MWPDLVALATLTMSPFITAQADRGRGLRDRALTSEPWSGRQAPPTSARETRASRELVSSSESRPARKRPLPLSIRSDRGRSHTEERGRRLPPHERSFMASSRPSAPRSTRAVSGKRPTSTSIPATRSSRETSPIPLKTEAVWPLLAHLRCTASVPGNRESHPLAAAFRAKLAGAAPPDSFAATCASRTERAPFPGHDAPGDERRPHRRGGGDGRDGDPCA